MFTPHHLLRQLSNNNYENDNNDDIINDDTLIIFLQDLRLNIFLTINCTLSLDMANSFLNPENLQGR